MIPVPEGLEMPGEQSCILEWWSSLGPEQQQDVSRLVHPDQESEFFSPITGEPVPGVVGGRFVNRADTRGWTEWNEELFEHLMCNPELVIVAPPVTRSFHICTQHDRAREVLRDGCIPADFRCPLRRDECPLRAISDVAPGHSLQLGVFLPVVDRSTE